MYHRIIIFILLFGCFTASAQKNKKKNFEELDVTQLSETDAHRVESMLIEAEKELILENYYKAYDLYKQALKITPDNPVLNFKTAEVLAKNGDNQNALVYANKAMQMDPTNKYYLLLAAEINKALANYDRAGKIYQQMIDNIEGTESYLFDLALIYQYQGKLQKALEAYNRAEEYYGMNEIVLREKQKIYLKEDNYDQLITDWDQLIAENPGEARFTIELCEFLISKNMIEEAQKRLSKLENSSQADLLLSQIALSQGNLAEALQLAESTFQSREVDHRSKLQLLNQFLDFATTPTDLEIVKELSTQLADQYPNEYEVVAFIGDVMYRLDQNENALKYYLKAVRVSPSNYGVWQNILTIEAELNQYDSVIVHAEKAMEYFPNQAALYYFAGTGYLIEKNFKRSIQILDQGKKFVTDPNLLTIFYGQMGDAYNSLKDYEKSDKAYDKALEADPNNDHVLNNYSYFLSLRNENLEKAVKMSTALVALHPENPTYLDTHGWVLYTMENYEEALVFLRKAANLQDDGTVIEHYGDVLYKLGKVEEAVEQWKRASAFDDASKNIQKKIEDRKLYE